MAPHRRPSTSAIRSTCLLGLVTLLASGSPARAQSPVPPLRTDVPPQLRNLTNASVTVTIPRLDPGQTVTQPFTPSPRPAEGVLSVTGTWPVAIVSGGEGQVNRKIKAVLRSPAGTVVAEGCGFSSGAKAVSGSSVTTPSLLAAGTFAGPSTAGPWSVAVSYCDGFSPPPSGASRVLGDIRLVVSFRAGS
jgi:hypothetical protein